VQVPRRPALDLAAFQSVLPPRATSNGTLRRLHEEAARRFATEGYHAVTVRELAEAVGIRVASLYSHVSSKEQLLRDLMLLGYEEHRDRLRRALLDAAPEPAAQLAALMGSHVRANATYPVLARVCNTEIEVLSPEAHRRVLAVRDDSVRMFTDVIQRGVELGAFHCPDPWLAAVALGGMGIRVAYWFTGESSYTVQQVVDLYVEFALKLVA
jgi:AcrR family transcriptional regulator